jgi:hypothetical protein
MSKPKKLIDVLKEIFGAKFGEKFSDDFFDFGKEPSPEEFMGGQEYSKTEETGTDNNGNQFTKTTYISKDGKRRFIRKTMNAKPTPKDNDIVKRSNQLYTLEQDLLIAVEKEEYEKASKIRDEISTLKKSLNKRDKNKTISAGSFRPKNTSGTRNKNPEPTSYNGKIKRETGHCNL